MTISYRPMVPDDRQFVLSGWSSSFRTSMYAGLIRNSRWAKVMHEEFGAVIDSPDTSVTVACEPGEIDHEGREFVYGFIATRRRGAPYVYYVYVKKSYRFDPNAPQRRFRIATGLFAAAGIDPREPFEYAASTSIADRILATCVCGLSRREHDEPNLCSKFVKKFPGSMDPVPVREAA